jgi:hypothetical protein
MLGLGQTTPIVLPSGGVTLVNLDPCSIPSWCSWMPFSSFMNVCKPPTPAQQQQCDMSNIGPAASPASVATLQQTYAQTNQLACQSDPAACQAYQYDITNPSLSAAFGDSPLGQFVGGMFGATDAAGNPTGIPWWIVLGGIGVLALVAMGGGSPRRYGP